MPAVTMHAEMIAALRAGWPIVHLVTVILPAHTIRWTDAGFLKWGADTWRCRDAIYGVLDSIGDITDGIDDDASPVAIRIIPPSLASMAALAAADAQGGWTTIHVACKNPATGLLVGEPYPLWLGELDQPKLIAGATRKLEYDIITGDARGLQPNEEQRQTDAFRHLIWPGERGDEYATEGTKWVYWREDEPRISIGRLFGRGGGDSDDNKAIEYNYEPNAPLAFPIGRFGVGGTVRYRVGYGPTNRYNSVVATFGASGPIKGVLSVSFDDEVTSFDGDDRAVDGDHEGAMWFAYQLGDQPSTQLTGPTGPEAFSGPIPGWTADHLLSGRPAFVWTGKENSKKDEFRGGVPKVLITGEGLFGHDPRDVGSNIMDPTTWPWMEEGCIAALNWCIGRWEGSDGGSPPAYGVPYAGWAVGGIAAPLATIDMEAFTEAADIADANGWTCAGVPFSDEGKDDVLADLLRASGAERSRRCGKLSCVSNGAVVASVLTVTQADTVSAPQISLAPSRLDRKNTGIASFISEDHRWELTPIRAITDAAWVTADGGRHTEGYDYKYCPDKDQAAQLVYLEMANAREGIQSETDFKPWMLQLEPGVAFTWNEPEYLLVGVKVRVRKRTWSPSKCTVRIEYREETDAKIAAALSQVGIAPPSSGAVTPPGPYVEPPSSVSASVAAETVTLAWRNPGTVFENTRRYRGASSVFGAATIIGGSAGGLLENRTATDTPGVGTWFYWLTATDADGNESEAVGPVSVIVADLRTTSSGDYRVASDGSYRALG